ncbi:DEAD-domain-containing protein [Polychaeton citri CBS 116435]|uniref:ATP-dependent RNA helicase n=1 Tax=Polychaeton citri CBS 116435 TaxID=1314669 RepID=A0A9P4UR38_9PEZI|nr:DEAD-domain-containing protein [Polychaeton citri CBS 116435]
MRRAFQRTQAQLPRFSSALRRSGVSRQLALQSDWLLDLKDIKQGSLPSATRAIHHSLRLTQNIAAAKAEANTDAPTNASEKSLITKFHELETQEIVHRNVVKTLTQDMGLSDMTEVQTKTINQALSGNDIIAQAKTGTGKTLAFLLPILQNILNVDPSLAQRSGGRRGPRTTADDIRALIISPTRELAEQIAAEAKKLVRNTGVIVQTAVGGTQKSAGLRNIQHQGCHILVGTPGRLKDIFSDPRAGVQAPDLSALVFDEADRLLDQGFWPEIQEIMRLLPTPAECDRQTMMFSATVPRGVVDLVRSTLKPGFDFVRCVRDDEEPTHARVPQKVVTFPGLEQQVPALVELCTRCIKEGPEKGRPFKAIVYCNSTAEATLVSDILRNLATPGAERNDAFGSLRAPHPWSRDVRLLEIHAKLSQAQRTQAAESFRHAQSGILLSSDVTARGMDFPNVTHVIQMGTPPSREQYIHRLGRTARAGKEGEGWLFLHNFEAREARSRLGGLPLQKDESLTCSTVNVENALKDPESPVAMVRAAMKKIPKATLHKSYLAMFGVYQWIRDKQALAYALQDLAIKGWGLTQTPSVPPGIAQRLGFSRVEGVRLGHDDLEPDSSFGGGSRGGSSYGRSGGFGDRRSSRSGFGDDRGPRSSRSYDGGNQHRQGRPGQQRGQYSHNAF